MSSRPSRGAARLAAILDALPDALLLVNCNGTVVNANTIALEAFETPGTALVGRGLLDLLPEFDPNRIPGSMRRPDQEQEIQERQKPTRMVARRTDGSEFPVEVTSANLEDGRTPYASAFEAAFADHGPGRNNSYTGNELLMLVVRDLTGTLDTETELARQQRQTEMILRAASEGVVGVDTAGRVVLVNPAAAQILGFRASDLGGRELHGLVHHSRPDGSPLPYEETPIADSLRSGRKHRIRVGQVLWTKAGHAVPVDMTTAPVRDGEQLVGAVMTFTDRRAYEDLAARHEQLRSVLTESMRKPLDQMRDELAGLASDPAGQLWPEANQILHHLAAGYSRIMTLVDNVLSYQQLDAGREKLRMQKVPLNEVVSTGIEGAVELIGPGRAQFALHTPPIEAEVDPERLATAIAHLVADVAGVDASGNAPVVAASGVDSTIVVAVAQRGEVVRIEVRGPHRGGDPVHEPIVRGIVKRHGGVLQTHDVPGAAGGSAYVLEVPVSASGGATAVPAAERSGPATGSVEVPAPGDTHGGAAPGGANASVPKTGAESADGTDGSGRSSHPQSAEGENETTVMPVPAQPVRGSEGSAPAGAAAGTNGAWTSEGAQQPAGPGLPAADAEVHAVPPEAAPPEHIPDGAPGPVGAAVPGTALAVPEPPHAAESVPQAAVARPTGRRRGRPSPAEAQHQQDAAARHGTALALPAADADRSPQAGEAAVPVPPQGTGRRARRPAAQTQNAEAVSVPAQPARAGGMPELGPAPGGFPAGESRPVPAQFPAAAPPQQQPEPQEMEPAAVEPPAQAAPAERPEDAFAVESAGPPAEQPMPMPEAVEPDSAPVPVAQPQPEPEQAEPQPADGGAAAEPADGGAAVVASSPILGGGPLPPEPAAPAPAPGPAPGEQEPGPRVRTLGQGVPFSQRVAEHAAGQQGAPLPAGQQENTGTARPALPAPSVATAIPSTPSTPAGSGRRRRLATPPGEPPAQSGGGQNAPAAGRQEAPPGPMPQPQGRPAGQQQAREFAIGAPAAGTAEGPEPLDGPDSLVKVTDGRGMSVPEGPLDDELPPEPLDNPRRLLVWPEPDASTRQALSDHGYRPVIVNSRDEVDAQTSAYPAALFVDPLTGPVTRKALQSLRSAAVAAEIPVLVTAGLGQAPQESAYGADPAVLLKALAPQDSAQHPPRVLLIEEQEAIAGALTASLERRGMQVAHARTDSEAVDTAAQTVPNLVVMDLMQVRRRRAGLIDWLRTHGMLNRTPFVVYTAVDMDAAQLPLLATGETVLFLAERSTSDEVQSRIVDLLTKIGAN